MLLVSLPDDAAPEGVINLNSTPVEYRLRADRIEFCRVGAADEWVGCPILGRKSSGDRVLYTCDPTQATTTPPDRSHPLYPEYLRAFLDGFDRSPLLAEGRVWYHQFLTGQIARTPALVEQVEGCESGLLVFLTDGNGQHALWLCPDPESLVEDALPESASPVVFAVRDGTLTTRHFRPANGMTTEAVYDLATLLLERAAGGCEE